MAGSVKVAKLYTRYVLFASTDYLRSGEDRRKLTKYTYIVKKNDT